MEASTKKSNEFLTFKLFLAVSMIMGVIWLELLINILIDMVVYIRVMTNSTEIFMGMTILAVSNSFVDMFVTGALAAQGYEIMAITGIFAGQMFNFLFGFGVSSLIKYFGTNEFKDFNLYKLETWQSDKEGIMTFYMLIWSICTLSFLLIYYWTNK
jgi:Ca2+/Na+ antiporter